jgi:hypothetical protein
MCQNQGYMFLDLLAPDLLQQEVQYGSHSLRLLTCIESSVEKLHSPVGSEEISSSSL